MMISSSEMNFLRAGEKIACCSCKRRRMLVKRKGKKYVLNCNKSNCGDKPYPASRFGYFRRSTKSSHFFCKAVLLLVILEGLGRGSFGATMIAPVEGASADNNGDYWQSNQYQQDAPFGGGGGDNGEDDDNRGSGSGTPGDSFMSTFTENRVDAARRMRDRCGRYSLLKVLQQWESLQRRCRLSVRNIINNMSSSSTSNNTTSYQYFEDLPPTGDGHDFMVAPPSPLSDDSSDSVEENIPRIMDKRSRHHYYSAISHLRVNNNDHDNEFKNYYYEVNGDALESCCPVVFEVIAPIYGRNRSGHMVELYKDENVQQKFNEYRCHQDYVEKPCRFVEGQYRRISKCVQQFLDTYALVRSDKSMTGWSMEHIRVASGCACKVDPASKRRKKEQKQLLQHQRRNQRRSQSSNGDPSDYYRFRNSLMNKKKRSKSRSFERQLLRWNPGFSDY